jgi:hypothetical protein
MLDFSQAAYIFHISHAIFHVMHSCQSIMLIIILSAVVAKRHDIIAKAKSK